MDQDDTRTEDFPAEDLTITGRDTQLELPSLTGMIRSMMEDRERRERAFAEERERMDRQREADRRHYAEEGERRTAEMQRQVERLQEMVSEHAASRPRGEGEPVKLTRLSDGDDIEAYLTTFERIMEAHEVRSDRWSFKLAPQLTGKAQQAYAALPPDDARSYEALKAAILRRYNINGETYRQRFRKLKPTEGESPQELITRLQDLATRWTKDCASTGELLDLVVREQFLSILPTDVRVAVMERQPQNCGEAGQFAESYLQARSASIVAKEAKPTTKCPRCGQHGHWARNCPGPSNADGRDAGPRNATTGDKDQRRYQSNTGTRDTRPQNTAMVRCYSCNEKGHYASSCPKRSLYCGRSGARAHGQDKARRHGTVNGVYCSDILVDTGATQTLVHKELVADDDILDGEVTVRCAHGDTVSYPLAVVKVNIGGKDIITTAAVSNTLPASVLLGWDVPQLMDLVATRDGAGPNEEDVLAAMTRLRRRQPRDEQPETDVPAAPTPGELNPIVPEPETDNYLSNLDESLFSPTGPPRPIMTRAQKRENRRRYRQDATAGAPPCNALNITAGELRVLQEGDESLRRARAIANGAPSAAAGDKFSHLDGLLYRQYSPPGTSDGETIEQLVLPTQCRPAVLRLAHDIPMAGHLGRKKTADRILRRFYWPGVFRDVEDHCRACEQCQKTATRGVGKAPLIPLPIMDAPFKRIAMDIVGPLPRSSSGKRFILVICDYATRYPEAIALRTIDANAVAGELLKFFARVGVPEEILTDQGTNFTSQLIAEVYRLLQIKPIRTTPYHPQTDGLVERFNGTLKSMLRKTANEEGKDWDRLLPYLLFAYREVPQASTGFSPFELLYGHHVRGPLDVLKESWEASTKSPESVVSYVLTMQERLTKLRDVVHENLEDAQATQKAWYDRHARHRELQPGDQVLVLLPTSTNKLLAEWCGPYPVVRQTSPVNYEVNMTDRRKKKRIFHVNMLRRWHAPSAVSLLAEEVHDGTDDVVLWDMPAEGNTEGTPVVSTQLSPAQRTDLHGLLQEFRDVMSNRPGKTQITECRITTGAASPIRLPPYRLPHAYRDTVKTELEQMELDGIIERSSSEWAFPIVLVKKKDGTLRICVDYRRLNAVAEADAYPMPRVDDLIDSLGKARYITTLDLARGYWQVPVSEESRPRTAFTTPYGLFQFRVMPFGLHGAPATFQRMMDQLLVECTGYAAAYLDDVVIYSTSWEDHIRHVHSVLQRLRGAGLTIKPKKCQFAMDHCTYLGHVVGNGEVRPEKSKIYAVEHFPTPSTKKQVRAFLGLTGYYRKFIADYANLAATLTDLTKKDAPNRVKWTTECGHAFQALKDKLCSKPILKSPDFDRQFILQTDASDRGVGAVLCQHDDHAVEHPVAFYSRKLLPREERYSTIEKECLAIKVATHAFRVYLLGRQFVVQTDHRALEWLHRLKDNNARLTRWSLALQPYQFVVQYRAGTANANADALSRAYPPPDDTTSSQEKEGGV